MSRVDNWPRLLSEYLQSEMDRPFEWGVHDCLLFSASCVHVVTGVDPAASYRRAYDSALGAYRIMNDAGGFDALIEYCMPDYERVHLNFAQRGDVVSRTDEKGRIAAGICVGSVCVFAGIAGLVFFPKSDCNLSAWRIG